MRYYDIYESPQGRMLLVATDDGIAGIYFERQKYIPKKDKEWRHAPDHAALKRVRRELGEYFAGRRTRFDVPLDLQGTAFQRKVWNAIGKVAYGRTLSYGELAKRAGEAGSARAAGAATGRNPIGIIVPCHRIMGANGALTGYAGGIKRKRALLALEADVRPGRR